jgi:hypothetical protein
MLTPWQLYAVHRARVTALLLDAAPPRAGDLLLLGAGRCRDVDLVALAARYRTVHLVDIERGYLESARDRQPAAVRERLRLHAGVELGGLQAHLAAWKQEPPDDAAIARVADSVPGALAARLPACEVAASTCLLSQLSYQAGQALGVEHPALARVRAGLLASHLGTLAALTRPGGCALLINDLTVAPRGQLEAQVVASGPRALAEALVASGDHFRGGSPAAAQALLRDDPVLAARVAAHELLEPWLWTRTSELTYLVYGLRFRLRA